MRFGSNTSIINDCALKRNRFIFLFALGILLTFLILILYMSGSLESFILSFQRDSGADRSGINIFIWLLIIFSCSSWITHLIGIIKLDRLISQMEASFICIETRKVTGFGCLNGNTAGAPFSVEIEKIASVHHNGLSDGYNLTFTTSSGTYKCLAIADAPKAVEMINRAISDFKNKASSNLQFSAQKSIRKCIFCNADLLDNWSFCGACGRRQN